MTGRGLARVGLLDDGRDFAATRSRVDCPGRRSIGTGETVETWLVGGRKATNRAGAAEYLGLAPNTVTVYSAPSGRAIHGWPEPLDELVEGQEVFALDDLDAFAASRIGETPAPPGKGNPNELVGVEEFAALKGVKRDTFKRYVEDSIAAWERGEDGYLPRPNPDDCEPARARGTIYRWRRGVAVAWGFPTGRRTGGRKPGPRPQVADLRAVLAAGGAGEERPTVRELAAALTAQLGTDVSSQVVRRLLQRMRAEDDAGK